MAGLSEIAKRAGVSVATVSLALRGRAGVARETVDRVKAVAADLGYRPNPLLSSLASKKFRSAGVVAGTPLAVFVFPLRESGRWPVTYEKSLLAHARELGYALTVYRIDGKARPAAVYRELYHRMVQGILVLGGLREDAFFQEFDWGQFSVVQCGRYFGPQPFHIVRPNIFQAVKLAFEELQKSGYRRIGYAVGRHTERMEDDDARFGAAVAMESALQRARDRVPVYGGRFDNVEALIAWAEKYRPDALIGFSEGIYWNLRDHGFRMPEDFGFATMHATGQRHPSGVLCSGTMQNQDMIARQSVMLLDQLIRNRDRGRADSCLDVLVRSTWLQGNTTTAQNTEVPAIRRSPRPRAAL